MSSLKMRLEAWLLLIIILILLLITGIICHCCKQCNVPPKGGHGKDSLHVSWNILLSRPTTTDTVGDLIEKAEASITAFLETQGFKASDIRYKPYYCPCDSLLVNLDLKILDETGGSKVTPPDPGVPVPAATSGSLYASLQYNLDLGVPELLQEFPRNPLDSAKRYHLYPYNSSDPASPLVVIIDSGIDTAYARESGMQSILIIDNRHMYNFLPFDNTHRFQDDDVLMPHGTFVAGVITDRLAVTATPHQPGILPLKALDAHGHGTVFSASCAMSYAIQQHAKVINASWGYYGSIDSVLMHYMALADSLHIVVTAAAGNVDGAHNPDSVKFAAFVNPGGKIDGNNPFYPAAFKKTMPYVVSVTGINNVSGGPCYYQRYSNRYVSVGVKERSFCCAIQPTLFPDLVEGSSFEAPAIAGRIALAFAADTPPPFQPNPLKYITDLQSDPVLFPYVQGGLFFLNQ